RQRAGRICSSRMPSDARVEADRARSAADSCAVIRRRSSRLDFVECPDARTGLPALRNVLPRLGLHLDGDQDWPARSAPVSLRRGANDDRLPRADSVRLAILAEAVAARMGVDRRHWLFSARAFLCRNLRRGTLHFIRVGRDALLLVSDLGDCARSPLLPPPAPD